MNTIFSVHAFGQHKEIVLLAAELLCPWLALHPQDLHVGNAGGLQALM